MTFIEKSAHVMKATTKGLEFVSPALDLFIRLWVANVFFKSGLTKIQSWESTVGLFEYEYNVPLLPPVAAATLSTAAELVLPALLAAGLATRLTALGLFAFNAVAVLAYSSFLLSDEGTAGLQQHIYWGLLLLVTVFHGPGRLSVDHLISKKFF